MKREKLLRVAIVVDAQETDYRKRSNGWQFDWVKVLDFYRAAYGVDAHIIWRPLDNRQWRLSWNAK
jgi:hypothetical protein